MSHSTGVNFDRPIPQFDPLRVPCTLASSSLSSSLLHLLTDSGSILSFPSTPTPDQSLWMTPRWNTKAHRHTNVGEVAAKVYKSGMGLNLDDFYGGQGTFAFDASLGPSHPTILQSPTSFSFRPGSKQGRRSDGPAKAGVLTVHQLLAFLVDYPPPEQQKGENSQCVGNDDQRMIR